MFQTNCRNSLLPQKAPGGQSVRPWWSLRAAVPIPSVDCGNRYYLECMYVQKICCCCRERSGSCQIAVLDPSGGFLRSERVAPVCPYGVSLDADGQTQNTGRNYATHRDSETAEKELPLRNGRKFRHAGIKVSNEPAIGLGGGSEQLNT